MTTLVGFVSSFIILTVTKPLWVEPCSPSPSIHKFPPTEILICLHARPQQWYSSFSIPLRAIQLALCIGSPHDIQLRFVRVQRPQQSASIQWQTCVIFDPDSMGKFNNHLLSFSDNDTPVPPLAVGSCNLLLILLLALHQEDGAERGDVVVTTNGAPAWYEINKNWSLV